MGYVTAWLFSLSRDSEHKNGIWNVCSDLVLHLRTTLGVQAKGTRLHKCDYMSPSLLQQHLAVMTRTGCSVRSP